MSDRYKALLRDPSLRREYERESLFEDAVSDVEGLMKSRGISQAELAQRLGVSPGRISQLLSGRRNITLKTLSDVAWALGMRVNLQLSVIDDLASTPAKDDSPIVPDWLSRRETEDLRTALSAESKVFISFSKALSEAVLQTRGETRRIVKTKPVQTFDPHADKSSIAA